MQKTANQIKSEFETLASGHYQIHSFLYAQEFEQQAYENLIYPLMLVYPLGGNLSGTTYSRNYRVIIADRVLKSEGNELEVESDTQLIALDVLAYWMKMGQNERFAITSSNTITPFWEKWGDEVTGHFVDIGIEEFYDFNSCAIPLSSAIPSPSNPCKDARILINSVIYGNAPSDSNFNVVVKNQSGTLVGSLIGGEWIVNTSGGCADATYTITNSSGTILYTGTIPSGGSLTQAISNSTLNVNNSASTLISSRSILAQGTDSYNVADSVAVIKDSAGTTLKTENILATASENITINDSVAVIKDSAGTTLKSENILAEASENITINDSTAVIKDSVGTTLKTEPILAEASENITISNSLVNVRKSDNVLISAVSVKAENTENYLVGDSLIENDASSPTYSQLVKATEGLILPTQSIQNNGVASGFIPSVGTINVVTNVAPTSFGISGRTINIVVPTGSTPSGVAFQMPKPSQYESYRTGDTGSRFQTGWYDITQPTYPKVYAELDSTKNNGLYLMKNNLIVNGVSSARRFVDVDGGQTFSATNNKNAVVIDKLSGLMYTRNNQVGSGGTWNDMIDQALTYSIVVNGVTYDDWYMVDRSELEQAIGGGYLSDPNTSVALFNQANATQWTSATRISSTTNAYYYDIVSFTIATLAKATGGQRTILVRKAHNLITAP